MKKKLLKEKIVQLGDIIKSIERYALSSDCPNEILTNSKMGLSILQEILDELSN